MEKSKRRSRKDLLGREYICECGKRYLSSPALYTHRKTKHDVKAMNEIPKPKIKSCNCVFEEFLKEMNGNSKYTTILETLRLCLNEKGYQMDNQVCELEYCASKRPRSIPNISNYFLIKYLPYKLENYDLNQATNALEDFCAWLYERKYTSYFIRRNEYYLDQEFNKES